MFAFCLWSVRSATPVSSLWFSRCGWCKQRGIEAQGLNFLWTCKYIKDYDEIGSIQTELSKSNWRTVTCKLSIGELLMPGVQHDNSSCSWFSFWCYASLSKTELNVLAFSWSTCAFSWSGCALKSIQNHTIKNMRSYVEILFLIEKFFSGQVLYVLLIWMKIALSCVLTRTLVKEILCYRSLALFHSSFFITG